MSKQELCFDVRKYRDSLVGLLLDLRTLVTEQAQGAEWHERVVPYELNFDNNGMPIGFRLDFGNRVAGLESQAVLDIYQQGVDGARKMVWISPPTNIYSQTRVVLLERKEGVNMAFDCVAICAPHSQTDCLGMAKVLGVNVVDADELRGTVIAIDNWQNVLDLLGMSKVSDVVLRRDFGSYDGRVARLDVVSDQIADMVRGIDLGDYWKAVRVGAQIEQVLARNGLALTSRGSCGVSNGEMMATRGSVFSNLYLASPVVGVASGEAYFECPKCNGKIPSGKGITTCPHCGMKKEDCGVVCG